MADKFKTARELFQADKFEKAREWLEGFIKRHPNDAQAYLNLSLVLDCLEKTKESSEAQNKAFEIDPNCSLGFSNNSIVKNNRVLTEVEKVALMDALSLSDKGKAD
jgi:tetratricopeptide (TPR) repeat protein